MAKPFAGVGRLAASLSFAAIVASCAFGSASQIRPGDIPQERLQTIRRAHVWTPTDVSSMDLRAGPRGPGAFSPEQTVTCDYVDERLEGSTPKFHCAIDGKDIVKIKYGSDNGEVYGEVAASRLFWALGFPSDAQYPVRVV